MEGQDDRRVARPPQQLQHELTHIPLNSSCEFVVQAASEFVEAEFAVAGNDSSQPTGRVPDFHPILEFFGRASVLQGIQVENRLNPHEKVSESCESATLCAEPGELIIDAESNADCHVQHHR